MVGPAQYDHTVTVWRSTESRGALREVTRSWSKVAGAIGTRMGVQPRRERRQDTGGGERVTGEYAGYGPAGLDVQEGDVVQVTAGPEAPCSLLVDAASRPLGHHLEATMVSWKGELE